MTSTASWSDDDACGATERRQKFVRHVRGNQDAGTDAVISADTDEATMRIVQQHALCRRSARRSRR